MLVASYFMAEIEGIISIKLLWLFTGNILDKYRNRGHLKFETAPVPILIFCLILFFCSGMRIINCVM